MKSVFTALVFVCIITNAYSQNVVSGKISDALDGTPLAGATVKIKGTSKATVTDNNGNFKISASKDQSLTVSNVGYADKEIAIGNETNFNITLARQENTINEVVVTAVGIKRSEKALGYSVSKVNPDNLIQKSEPDLLKSMQGKVAGVDIRSSQGTPGSATRIQLRGNSSFFGDNQPLIVVDGIPFSNNQVTTSSQTTGGTAYSSGIADLDPNDIATLNVLKGSAAAALYGSRASNGVIIITTKSGSATRSRKGLEVSYRSSFSLEQISNLPKYQNIFGAGTQFNYANANGSWGPAFNTTPGGGVTYEQNGAIVPNGGNVDSIYTWPSYLAAYPELFGQHVAYVPYPHNVKDLFNTGKVYENSIGFSGGDEKNSVALTASQLNQTGYVPNSAYDRTNIGLGGSTKLNIGLNIRGNLSYEQSKQKGGYFGENQVGGAASEFARSLFPARNWDFNLPYQDKDGNTITPNGGGQFDNPRWSAQYNVATTNTERIIAGVHADFNINNWIRVDYNIGNNVNTVNRREVTEISSRAAQGLGSLVLDNYRIQEIESTLLLTFTPKISNDLTFRGVIGHNYNQRTQTRQAATGNQFIVRGIHTLSNTVQQIFGTVVNGIPILGDYYERRRLIGIFGDAALSYKNYAFVEITGRNDWSSTLPITSRSYFYPSVSGSLIFTDALKLNSPVLTYGKLRAGWAKVGRDADPYSLQDVFTLGTNFLGQPTASVSVQKNNPDLKPEFTQEVEAGAQLDFFKGRIGLDFTWYHRTSTNLIAPIATPPSSGYSQYITNYGKISNKGVEIDFNVVPIKLRDFSWEVHAAFTKNKSVVEELVAGVERLLLNGVLANTISPYLEPGLPFGYLRGTKVLRDSLGNVLINPATGGMILDPNEGFIGDPNPDYKLGITNTFTYKGFQLSVLFDITKGGGLYSETVNSLLGRGVTLDTRDRQTTWIIPGVYGDPNTGLPILGNGKEIQNHTQITSNDLYFSQDPTNGVSFAFNGASEFEIFDATVYRLREITLAYEFPKSLFKKLPIGSLTLSASGRNLWFLAPGFPKYTNFDPEVNSYGATTTQGIELSAAPTTRRFGVNLNVTF
jgi:TonB-linked SusC/RagA family outer membrane protein